MREVFIKDILENPDDDTPRRIYVDWLYDNNMTKEADELQFQLDNSDIINRNVEPYGPIIRLNGVRLIRVRRGFLEYIECALNTWQRHGPYLVKHNPITKIKLTDREPEKSFIRTTLGHKVTAYYWFSESGATGVGHIRHRIPNHIHHWMINNECGRKGNTCWYNEEAAWYALILWAKAQNKIEGYLNRYNN